MTVGSQRIAIEHPETAGTFKIAREAAPDVPIFGNLGAVQLNYGVDQEHIEKVADLLQANGIFLHLNPLQEAIQTGGDTNFRGVLERIGELSP